MKNIKIYFLGILISICSISCNDFLNKEPISEVPPISYFRTEDQLGTSTLTRYGMFPTHSNTSGFGVFGIEQHTDNQAHVDYSNKYIPGEWKVPEAGGSWSFGVIFELNYFFENTLPKWEAGEITGDPGNIKHYIGEAYFLRAFEYFKKLETVGDYPILTKTLPDVEAELTEASKRAPRSEVARFILSDLDKAISLLKVASPDGKKNRISRYCAYLFKSRVALFEASWLTYFKGTSFVPNGPGWPGADKDYNADYQYRAGSIDHEIQWLLDESMAAALNVTENISLEVNSGILAQNLGDLENRYADMFGALDMSMYDEVLMWRQYDRGLGVTHNVPVQSQAANNGIGLTRGLINSFLMEDGYPFYKSSTSKPYQGDNYVADVRKNRDGRLFLFLKEPGQKNVIKEDPSATYATPIEPQPWIISTDKSRKYTTGYASRKGIVTDQAQCFNNGGYTGCLIFRATEAYLNYIEAFYMKNGVVSGKADQYWKAIRDRAKVSNNYQLTISNTDMTEEAKWDWAAYSGGVLVDPVLFNIRRERRCELMTEGLRWMDLKRWRALDQMVTTPYHIEGFKLWGPMQSWYTGLIYGSGNSTSNVSDPTLGDYLRPYEVNGRNLAYNGYKWHMAHYLDPIAIKHMLLTTSDGDVKKSVIYQNPYWPYNSNQAPE